MTACSRRQARPFGHTWTRCVQILLTVSTESASWLTVAACTRFHVCAVPGDEVADDCAPSAPPPLTGRTHLQAASGSSPAAVKAIARAVGGIADVPLAVKSSLDSLASSLTAALASRGLVPDFTPVHNAALAAWSALRSSDLVPDLPSAPELSMPGLSDLPSFEQLQAGAVADITSSPLFNGSYSEEQVVGVVSAIIAVCVVSAATARATQAAAATASDAELPTEYDQEAIYRYWSTRPTMLFKRSIETAWLASGFLVGLQLDKLFGEEKKNEKLRARTLRLAIDRLGPAYIKIAQALSTRVDLLSPAYFEEITLLQDRVQEFPSDQAMAIMEARRRRCMQLLRCHTLHRTKASLWHLLYMCGARCAWHYVLDHCDASRIAALSLRDSH
jgi:hypothetical protein